jgi:hypothetical protein
VDKNEAFFAETKDYAKFYAAKGDRYDWDRAPSTPCPKLVGDILAAFLKQTDLLTPNGVRDTGGSQFTATAASDATSCVPPAVSRVSGEQIRLLISHEARAVLDAARALYREFYANITHTPWMDWKIETWDVGYYQIRNAMKDFNGRDARCPSVNGQDARFYERLSQEGIFA